MLAHIDRRQNLLGQRDRDWSPGADAFAAAVERGLTRSPKTLSSAWFYDARGSRLFEQITQQPEYYLTRCEQEILETHAGDVARELHTDAVRVVEIGAGDGRKTEVLLSRFIAAGCDIEYVPVDICRQAVVDLTTKLRRNLSSSRFQVRGVVADYFEALPLLGRAAGRRNLVLFLGSSIGNFGHRQARRLLQRVRDCLAPGDWLLIGCDLKKDPDVLQAAYDDAAGVTREFNFNLLDRINRELGGEFDRRQFSHRATYNLRLGCMESWLVSRELQQVPIRALHTTIPFARWEGIRVERSYKYDLAQIESLGDSTGFEVRSHFLDRQRLFVDSLWEAT